MKHKAYTTYLLLALLLACCALLPAQLRQTPIQENPGLRLMDQMLAETGQRWSVRQARLHQSANPHKLQPTPSDAVIRDRMGKLQSPLPLELNPVVKAYIQLYTVDRHENFEAVLGLAEHHLPPIRRELEAAGLPADLQYLPVALSALNPRHHEEDGTAGLWRLHWITAARLGIAPGNEVDLRRDEQASTRAAVRLLREYRRQMGGWQMAIAAFACGPAAVSQAAKRSPTGGDYWALYPNLPAETRDLYPAFIAAVYACRHQAEHGLTPLAGLQAAPVETVTEAQPLHLAAVAQTLGLELDQLRELNPSLVADRVGTGFALSLPFGQQVRYAKLRDQAIASSMKLLDTQAGLIHVTDAADEPSVGTEEQDDIDTPDPNVGTAPAGTSKIIYRIRAGDNLGAIADKFDVTVSRLKQWNGLSSDRIKAGASLDVYVPSSKKAKYESIAKGGSGATTSTPGSNSKGSSAQGATDSPKSTYYTVRSGDNLWSIAKKYPGVTERMIMDANHLSNDKIKPGQRLLIPSK